jgi:ABC-type spermidine/putrescine transport system permease subunit I
MMKKTWIIILSVSLSLLIVLCYWFMIPNTELQARHQATLCNVLKNDSTLKNYQQLFEQIQFSYHNSTPSYAYHPTPFYKYYAQHLAYKFTQLDATQQQQARQSYETCRLIFSK